MSDNFNDSRIRLVIVHRPGPNWKVGLDFQSQHLFQEHSAHCFRLFHEGRIAQGGPFADGSGGMMIARAGESFSNLQRDLESDPAVLAGVISVEVKPWLVLAGGDSNIG